MRLWFALLLLVGLSSCSKSDPITQYTVKKPVEDEQAEAPAEARSAAWFFKLSGPAGSLAEHLEGFGQLVKSIQLKEGSAPTYEIPANWTEEAGSAMRYSTIKIPNTDPPLEVAVSFLPAPDPNSPEYLKANLDRWRGQLGLEPMSGEDWYEDAVAKGELAQQPMGSQTITIVHLLGTTEQYGETRMLTAMVTSGANPDLERAMSSVASSTAESPSESASGTSSSGLAATVPETWSPGKKNQFAVEAFAAKNDAGTVDITVSPVGGGALDNINRWCGQVGLPPMSETEYAEKSEAIEIGGSPGTFVHLPGAESAIAGAVVMHDGQQWFFKGRGPTAAVAQEIDRLKEYLKSVKFE